MDTTVPRKAVLAVAFILLVLACLGVYQGWRRAGSGETESDGGVGSLTSPVAGAKTASALAEAAAPPMTEAQVREIARQEARAALGLGKPATPASSESDETSATPTAKPATAAPAAPKLAEQPALQTPVAPPPAPAAGGQAPLF